MTPRWTFVYLFWSFICISEIWESTWYSPQSTCWVESVCSDLRVQRTWCALILILGTLKKWVILFSSSHSKCHTECHNMRRLDGKKGRKILENSWIIFSFIFFFSFTTQISNLAASLFLRGCRCCWLILYGDCTYNQTLLHKKHCRDSCTNTYCYITKKESQALTKMHISRIPLQGLHTHYV